MSLATIVWSKVKFMTRDVAISRKGILVIKPTQDTCTCVEKSETKNEVIRLVFRHLSLSFLATYQVLFPVVDGLYDIEKFLENVRFFVCRFKVFRHDFRPA